MDSLVSAFKSMVTEMKGWLLGADLAVATLVVVIYAIKYNAASAQERPEAARHIRNTIIWAGGIFVLIALVGYVFDKFQAA